MPTFSFKGTATIRGVVFYVEAPDAEEAKRKARLGRFDDEDRDGADIDDFKIDTDTCREEL